MQHVLTENFKDKAARRLRRAHQRSCLLAGLVCLGVGIRWGEYS